MYGCHTCAKLFVGNLLLISVNKNNTGHHRDDHSCFRYSAQSLSRMMREKILIDALLPRIRALEIKRV